jgi:hypothetical protein
LETTVQQLGNIIISSGQIQNMQDVFLTNIKQTGAALIEGKYGKVRQCTNDVQ